MAKWQKAAMGGLALSMVAGVVAGCGSSMGSGSGGSDSNSASGSIPKGITLTVWSWKNGPELADEQKIADAWGKQHGDTVKIIDQSQNPTGFKVYGTDARTGKGPDVVFSMPHDNNGLFAQEGLISKVPSNVYNASDYNQSVNDAVTVNGTVYSLPISVETSALFYNTSMIPNAPTDWNTFVKDANAHGFLFDYTNLYFNYAFIGGMGGYVFKNNNGTLDPNNIGLNNAGAVQAFQLLTDFNTKYHWMTPSVTGAIAKAKFSAGKLGMYISGPWDIPDLTKAGVKYAIAPLPTLPNGQPATPFMGVQTVLVNAHSKYQAADWSLAQALSSKDAQTAYFKDAQQIPALQSLQNGSDVQSSAYFKAFADQTKNAVPMPNIPQMQAVWGAMTVIKNIEGGKVSAKQGADDFVASIKKGEQVQGN